MYKSPPDSVLLVTEPSGRTSTGRKSVKTRGEETLKWEAERAYSAVTLQWLYVSVLVIRKVNSKGQF